MEEIHLDYTIQSPEERLALVNQILEVTPPEKLKPTYLTALSNYLIFAMDKQEKKKKLILTDNRLKTINLHETSYEGLCESLENGEDGIYNLVSTLGKSAYIIQKDPITDADKARSPEIAEIEESVSRMQEQYKSAEGRQKFLLGKQIQAKQQDKYIIRNDARGQWTSPSSHSNSTVRGLGRLTFYDDITFDECGNPVNNGLLSFFDPEHIEALLCNYSALKEEAWGNFENDLYYLMEDLDNLVESSLKEEYPLYYDLLIMKIDGKTNEEIQKLLKERHGLTHTEEYISALWRNTIPKLIAETAKEQYLNWYYATQEYGHWKKCTRCGQIKLAHNKFFSRNSSSKDGWYSLCKCCRNANSKKSLRKAAAKQKYLDSLKSN